MVSQTRRGPRGQALAETVLGLLVFVTILMFGIHFAEVGYLSLKVQEASTSALWDSTGAKMHELPGTFNGQAAAIKAAGGNATNRYKDFDGRSSQKGSSAPVQVFTSAGGLKVECKAANAITFATPQSTKEGVYKNSGGMTCSASATLSPTSRLTRHFLDNGQGALFKVAHATGAAIPVCGTGRAKGGECKGGFGILLDDWGLAGAQESRECKVLDGKGCANTAYYKSAQKVYDAYLPGVSSAVTLASNGVGSAPIDPGRFWMSFRGEESKFQDRENGGDSDPNKWVTTPGLNSPTVEYSKAYNKRAKYFLGRAPTP